MYFYQYHTVQSLQFKKVLDQLLKKLKEELIIQTFLSVTDRCTGRLSDNAPDNCQGA